MYLKKTMRSTEIPDNLTRKYQSELLKQRILRYFAKITQFLSWPIAFIFFNLFFNIKINGKENIRLTKSPFIIISNHISFYDSFVFRLVLGSFAKNLPLRFMAVNSFRTWYLNLLSTLFITDIIYALYGVFVVVRGRGIEKNLEDAITIIKNGGNVVIYPEGSIVNDGHIAEFKHGAAVLAQKTAATVIPIAMKIEERYLRNEFIINVGLPFKPDINLPAQEISNNFRRIIIDLHQKK